MPTLTLSFAPQTRTADAAVRAPRKNLRVLGSDTARLLFPLIATSTGRKVASGERLRAALEEPGWAAFVTFARNAQAGGLYRLTKTRGPEARATDGTNVSER